MKRKLVWQGNSSATLTLPISWVREQGLGEGAEIEVVPSGDTLIIGTKKNRTVRKVTLELKQPVGSAIKKLIANLYRVGYDEIELTLPDKETERYIQDCIWKELVGFESVKLNEKTILLKDIADLDPECFPMMFKKSFLLLLAFSQEVLHHVKEKDYRALEQAILRDLEINKITNLCRRLLHKKMNDRKKMITLASVLRALEKSGDCLKELAAFCAEARAFPPPKAIKTFEFLCEKIQEIYLLYYRSNLEKALSINGELRELSRSLVNEPALDKGVYRFYHGLIQHLETLTGGPMVLCLDGQETTRKEDWGQ